MNFFLLQEQQTSVQASASPSPKAHGCSEMSVQDSIACIDETLSQCFPPSSSQAMQSVPNNNTCYCIKIETSTSIFFIS